MLHQRLTAKWQARLPRHGRRVHFARSVQAYHGVWPLTIGDGRGDASGNYVCRLRMCFFLLGDDQSGMRIETIKRGGRARKSVMVRLILHHVLTSSCCFDS